MMQKQIAFISSYYFPHVGGIEQNIHKVSTNFNKNIKCSVLIPTWKNKDGIMQDGKTDVLKYSFLDFLRMRLTTYDAIIVTNFSILPHLLVMANVFIRGKKECRIIVVPHGGLTLDWSQFTLIQRSVKYIFNKLIGIPFLNIFADDIVAVSEWEKGALHRLGVKKNISLIRNGIDTDPGVKASDKKPYFMFLGRIAKIKNIEDSIMLFQNLLSLEKYKNYTFLIAGKYDVTDSYYQSLEQLINSNNLGNKVEFIGQITGSKKFQYLRQAEALICLSHWESDPIVIKEAFSVNTKVIVSGKYGLADLIGDSNAYTYAFKASMKDMCMFLNQPFQNQNTQKLYTWLDVAKKYEKLF